VTSGPGASVIAANTPLGGAGTGSPLIGLTVPACREKAPSLPSWFTRVQDVKPDSNPPFKIRGVAFATPDATRQTIETVVQVMATEDKIPETLPDCSRVFILTSQFMKFNASTKTSTVICLAQRQFAI